MSPNVCQGLQSCLEPRLNEPLVLTQNMASPQKPTLSPSSSIIPHDNDEYNVCHSFLDSNHQKNRDNDSFWSTITSQKSRPLQSEATPLYVHPMVKRCSSALSSKSLEMCTESLGSETGSSIGESIDDLPSGPLLERFTPSPRRRWGESPKKIYRTASFPPPLTSINGSDGVQMRPHREGGRLVLKAFSVPSCSPCFRTERSNGRLRLSLLKEEEEEVADHDDDLSNDVMHGHELQVEEEQLANADADEESTDHLHDDDDDDDDDENMEVNDENNVGYEVGGVGEFARPISSSRCKEGGGNSTRNKGIPSWEPFWVAIS